MPSVLLALGLLGATASSTLTASAADPAASTDPRFFSQTGFSVETDAFWSFFQARGGVDTFGYPASHAFLFEGCTVQFFQRLVMQQCGGQGVGTLNLLDSGLLPYTRINGSTFPAADPALQGAAPKPSDPDYGSKILDFVRANAPDTFDGHAVNFGSTFFSTVTSDTAGTDEPGLLGLMDLQIWGAPTSAPAYDPTNHNFVYQRFQRGILMYDAGCDCTHALLLADYLKDVLTGTNVPPDLAAEVSGSPLYKAVQTNALSATSFAGAFDPNALSGATTGSTPSAPPPSTPSPTPAPSPSGATGPHVASPTYGISMFYWGHPDTTARDLGLATSARFQWQKTLFQWRLIEPQRGVYDWSEADRVVQASNRAGVKILARLDFNPDWARSAPLGGNADQGPPDNYQDYWDFVSAFVSRYRTGSAHGTVSAIEIWNEVNLTREWGGAPISPQQAADYVRLLQGSYQAAHAADPNIVVITAGLSPTGVKNSNAWDDVEYLQWLFDAGLRGGVNYDVLGAHGNTQAPSVSAPLNSLPQFPDASFYFRRIEQLRDVQVRNGDAGFQIWLLEFGWTSDTVHPAYSWFAVSEQQKAQNVIEAFQYARQNWSPWIGVMTLWTMSDPNWTPDREEYWWAVTNPDGTTRPAYDAVKAARINGTLP